MLNTLFFMGFLKLSVPAPPTHLIESAKCDPTAPPFSVLIALTENWTTRSCLSRAELFTASAPPGAPQGLRVYRESAIDILVPGEGHRIHHHAFHAEVTVEGEGPARVEVLRLRPTREPADLVIEYRRPGGEKPSTPEVAIEAFKKLVVRLEITR